MDLHRPVPQTGQRLGLTMRTSLPAISRLRDRPVYGWVVVAAFFLITVIILGVRLSFGVFFKSIEGDFGLTRAATSAVFSAYTALGSLFAILGGWALDRYGPMKLTLLMGLFTGLGLLLTSRTGSHWQLFLTFSLPLAVGGGALFTVSSSTISRWFDKSRTLALGIAQSGAGFGTLVMSPFAAYLIATTDWRMAYVIMGLMAWLVVLPLSGLLFNRTDGAEKLPAGARATGELPDRPFADVFKNRNYWLLFFNFLLFGFCLFLAFTHLVPHATDLGIPVEEAATIMSLVGLTSIVGRILMSIVADRMGRKRTAVVCTLMQAIAILWLIWTQSLWTFYVVAMVFGFGQGGLSPATSAMVGDVFGLRKIGMILGTLDVGFGIGAASGPVIGGFIFDVSHSYAVAFFIGAVAMFIAALLIGLVRQDSGNSRR